MIQLGSINLIVRDISTVEKFYVEMLGLTVDPERTNRPMFVLLRAANCMLILQQASTEEVTHDKSSIELAFQADDVEAIKQKLGPKAVVQKMGWGNAIETTDPEGTRLNLYRWS